MNVATTKQFRNIEQAVEQLLAAGEGLAGDELAEYLAACDAATADVRRLRAAHARAIRNEASRASKARRAQRVAAALALLDEKERAGQQ